MGESNFLNDFCCFGGWALVFEAPASGGGAGGAVEVEGATDFGVPGGFDLPEFGVDNFLDGDPNDARAAADDEAPGHVRAADDRTTTTLPPGNVFSRLPFPHSR